MDWKTGIHALSRVLALLSASLIVFPLSFLYWGIYRVGRRAWRLIEQRQRTSDAPASIQLSINTAELHEEGNNNNMATQPIQEAPGAQPEPPQPVQLPVVAQPQGFAAWWADLEEASQKYGTTFTVQQARALYERANQTPAPTVQQEAGESGVAE